MGWNGDVRGGVRCEMRERENLTVWENGNAD